MSKTQIEKRVSSLEAYQPHLSVKDERHRRELDLHLHKYNVDKTNGDWFEEASLEELQLDLEDLEADRRHILGFYTAEELVKGPSDKYSVKEMDELLNTVYVEVVGKRTVAEWDEMIAETKAAIAKKAEVHKP